MSTTSAERIQCTGCKSKFKVKPAAIGKKVKCPKCQTVFKAIAMAATVKKAPIPQATPSAPQGTKRCDMCHEFVPLDAFDEHYQQHQGKLDDGQHSSYPTLPPEKRWKGDLSTVPQNYIHPQCGSVTGMPEEIIRTYLVNPYFYGYSSFCCGCGTHISGKELKWVDSNEDLFSYTKRLQSENPDAGKYRAEVIRNLFIAGLLIGCVFGLLGGIVGYFVGGILTGGTAFLGLTAIGTLVGFAIFFKMRGGI